eukprot:scaffold4971_cov94-Isochrysis_galbana.AAC.5
MQALAMHAGLAGLSLRPHLVQMRAMRPRGMPTSPCQAPPRPPFVLAPGPLPRPRDSIFTHAHPHPQQMHKRKLHTRARALLPYPHIPLHTHPIPNSHPKVAGLDNQPFFLRHLADFAAREGLADSVHPVLCDLRLNLGGDVLETEIIRGGGTRPAARPHAVAYAQEYALLSEDESLRGGGRALPLRLVVVSRFMHRGMLDRVVRLHSP